MNEHSNRMIERLKDFYKSKLLELGYFKNPDGRQLYEHSIEELKEIYETIKEDKQYGKRIV